MDDFTLNVSIISCIIAFVMSMILTNRLIPLLKKQNIVNPDLNKRDETMIPEMGGMGVILAFFLAMNFTLICVLLWDISIDFHLLALVLFTIMGVAFVGIMDDLLDLHQLAKSVLPFIIGVPLGVGLPDKTLTLPIFGSNDLGVWMIILVPLGLTAVTNLTNMLEGFNGLGSGLGIIVTVTLIIISLITDETDGLYLLLPLLGVLMGFLYFNKFPSRIFPGDTLMFFQGATIGCAAIIGDLKTIAGILYLPMLAEFIFKARGRFPAKNHGNITEDGTLAYDGKIYSLSHLLMKRFRVTEKGLVRILWTMEAILCTIMIITVFWLGPDYAW